MPKEITNEGTATPVTITPAIVHTLREQWLMRRRELITASDVGAILGVDPHRKAADVYLDKVGLRVVEETEPMRWGHRLEPAIAEGYREITGRVVLAPHQAYELDIHPSIPWLGATLDRQTQAVDTSIIPAPADGTGVLELKATSDVGAWEDEPPLSYQLQLTIQMACTSRSWGSLAAFVSMFRPVVWVDRVFDPELFALIVPKLEVFRHQVLTRTPPKDEPEWYSRAALRALWPADSGESIPLDHNALGLVEAWERLKESESTTKRAKEETEDMLRALMRDASVGYLPDGTSLTLKTVPEVQVAAHVRAPYRTLRRFWPRGMKKQLTKG